MQTLQEIAAIAQISVAVTALVVSAAITWIVNKRMKRMADLLYWRALGNAWAEIDKFAMATDQNLAMVDHLFHPDLADQPLEDRRKRWLGYLVLNVFSDTYHGVQTPPEIGPKSGHRDRVRKELEPLMQDDVVFCLSQSGLYSSEFEEVCADLRGGTKEEREKVCANLRRKADEGGK